MVLVGDLAELGAWDPSAGMLMSGEAWPTWSTEITLPRGVRANFKLVTLARDGGARWEPGDNRSFAAFDGRLSLLAR